MAKKWDTLMLLRSHFQKQDYILLQMATQKAVEELSIFSNYGWIIRFNLLYRL
jgi:hypothetical protein